ncbi:hypothetical protein [Ekhidna sp.]|uniref:hypothetical protein n=1 Tax=Ekhidna sp. TaxID=2608089 RepID=UPI003298A7C7
MKLKLTTYLFSCTILFSILANAQEAEAPVGDTILENENPYRKGQTKWLNQNEFYTEGYDWSDPEINLFLNKAVKRRSTSNALGIVGGSILVLGLVANITGSLVHSISDSNPNEEYQVIKGPYYLGGALVVTSVALSFDAIAKLNKAKNARDKKFK